MVLPKMIRDDFGLQSGDKLEAIEEDDQIILRPVHKAQMIKSKGGVLVFAGQLTGDVTNAISDSRKERLHKLASWEREK
jgi:AbrB family looped-hinge helix DNA binding protein